jgi:hypothetical protein
VPGSELYDINGNQLRDAAKWPHKAVDIAILSVVHLFASSCRPKASNGRDSRGSSFIPARSRRTRLQHNSPQGAAGVLSVDARRRE